MTDPAPADPAAISAVTVTLKLPPFWPSDPELWFAQVEAQFSCRRITTQKTKFDHVVSSLTPQFAAEVRDLLLRPPDDQPYDTLKAQLIRRTAASEQRKLQLLLTTEELGDRKPTQLLRRMQQLLGDRPGTDESVLKELFLQRLPPNVRMVLASTPDATTLDKLAEMADKIIEVVAPPPPTLATPAPSVAAANAPSPLETEVGQLRADLARLEKLVVQQLARPRSSSRSPYRSSRRSPSPAATPGTSTPTDAYCWYHRKFGSQAHSCRAPCAWSGNEQAGH